ncbi:hypothetical protein BS639_23565 [Rouxiella silvae]|uniref:Uncharacterized protein n=1 Tax=Rouxiella silvae TaxID=1646373 RepID=A0AA40WZZ2_9GAMM|nr:hypothetical protein [Rouxiella silvae]KQN51295.1 hypothetical protein ASE93_20925 [Serratia sp. Leaf50]MBF6635964.1 hypothetical protein [Rouxiella silvae]ORJ18758.1 hypothetical protein BS639_23565 [Rouxiella silvae]
MLEKEKARLTTMFETVLDLSKIDHSKSVVILTNSDCPADILKAAVNAVSSRGASLHIVKLNEQNIPSEIVWSSELNLKTIDANNEDLAQKILGEVDLVFEALNSSYMQVNNLFTYH